MCIIIHYYRLYSRSSLVICVINYDFTLSVIHALLGKALAHPQNKLLQAAAAYCSCLVQQEPEQWQHIKR